MLLSCNMQETEMHIFFECSFAKAVWFQSPLGPRTDALPQAHRGIHHQLTHILQHSQPHINAGFIFSMLWCLWKARNDRRFNNKQWSVSQVIHEATAINILGTLDSQEDEPLPTQRQQNDAHNGTTTTTGMQSLPMQVSRAVQPGPRIFTDASVCPTNLPGQQIRAGIGIFVMDNSTIQTTGIFFQVAILQVADPLLLEAQAMLLASRLVQLLQFHHVNYLTDNHTLAEAVTNNCPRTHPGHWGLRPVLHQIQQINATIPHVVIKIARTTNLIADKLARQARQSGHQYALFIFLSGY